MLRNYIDASTIWIFQNDVLSLHLQLKCLIHAGAAWKWMRMGWHEWLALRLLKKRFILFLRTKISSGAKVKRRTRLDTGKKFFLNKVSKYQPIIFSRLEWTDRQTNSVSKGKKKVSGKCQQVSCCCNTKYRAELPGQPSSPSEVDYVGLKATANGRFDNAPTPWPINAHGAGNKCPQSVHRSGQ